jgi:hypothetical protein
MSPTWFARFNAFADAARGTSYQGAPAHIEVIHRADDGRHGTLYSDHPEGARFRQPPSGVGGDLLRHRRTIVASDGASVASVGDPQACEAFYVVRGTGMRSFDDAETAPMRPGQRVHYAYDPGFTIGVVSWAPAPATLPSELDGLLGTPLT